MSFLAPLGLLALLTLPIIIVLHLMRERRRRVVVPSLLLWQLLPQRQEAQRRKRLPLTLLLLLHLLAAALLALALAQPQVQLNLFGGERHLALIIDTSTSMAADGRLDQARALAAAQLDRLAGRDSVVLISAGPQATLIGRAGVPDAPLLRAALDDLEAAGTGSDLAAALTLAEAALQGLPDSRIVVLTDAAIPQFAERFAARSGAIPISWQAIGAPLNNRALVTLATRAGVAGNVQVYARAVNYGDDQLQTTLRLYGDDELIDTRVVTFQPRGEVELTWSLPPAAAVLRAELDGRDALAIDDAAALRVAGERLLRTLLVSADAAALERALRAVPGLALQVLDPAAYRGSEAADLTVFDNILPQAWPEGAVLVVDPPNSSDLLDVAGFARTPSETDLRVMSSAALLNGISLGSVDFGSVADLTLPEWATPLLMRGDQALIVRGRLERSDIAIWMFDPERGNLTTRLAFPLLTARTVRDLIPSPPPAAAMLGVPLRLAIDPRADQVIVRDPLGREEALAVDNGVIDRLIPRQAGIYTLEELRAGAVLYRAQLPVNAGAPQESALSPQTLPPDRPAPPPQAAELAADGQALWPWLVGLALLVGMGEWVYVHGARRPGVGN